ncbi:unnamed protein product, partial [Ectocarpus sp. 13 AM-2016]
QHNTFQQQQQQRAGFASSAKMKRGTPVVPRIGIEGTTTVWQTYTAIPPIFYDVLRGRGCLESGANISAPSREVRRVTPVPLAGHFSRPTIPTSMSPNRGDPMVKLPGRALLPATS